MSQSQGMHHNVIVTRLGRIMDSLLPHREVMIRTRGRIAYFSFRQSFQLLLIGGFLVVCGWTSYFTVQYFVHQRVVNSKEAALHSAQQQYGSLLAEISRYQQKFHDVTTDLESNHQLMRKLVTQNAALQQNLMAVVGELENTETARLSVVQAREQLRGQMGQVTDEIRTLESDNAALKGHLVSLQNDLRGITEERNQAREYGKTLEGQLRDTKQVLADIQDAGSEIMQRLAQQVDQRVAVLEETFSIMGLDPDEQLSKVDIKSAMGGPFIASSPDETGENQPLQQGLSDLSDQIARWKGMKELMISLPLAPPIESFYVSGSYGKRRDPFNKRWAMHYGLDLGSNRGTSVFAPAQGKVIFAGWKGNYGKLIEIDHGQGIHTRYGHLDKILVKTGETVDNRHEIGHVGNTGRSTSSHLHYEVIIDGKTKNPMKFIRAGQNVF